MIISSVKSINTTPIKDFDPTDNKTTPLELQLFTLPVNDILILASQVSSETCELKGSVTIKDTKEEIPFDFKLHYKAIHDSNGEAKYLLHSFTGNVNNNQVKISGSCKLPSNVEEPLMTNIKVDSNGKNDSFIAKLNIEGDSNNIKFSNVILGQEGALKEEKATINLQELLNLFLTGTKCTFYETKGKILGTENEEKAELEPAEDHSFFNPSIKGTFKGKFGNNELTGSIKIKSDVLEVEKNYGNYLIKYTFK
jgi:hypothetical protein